MYYFRTIILFYYKVNELSLPGCEIRVFLLLFQLPVRITDYSSFSFVLVPVPARGECYMMMTLYCVAPDERRLKTN